MKNLFKPLVMEELISRIDKLTATSTPLWGKMNVNQALRHMTMALHIADGRITPTTRKLPMPKWLLRFFLLNMKPPKGKAETFKEINTVANSINPADFEQESNNLKRSLEELYNSTSLLPENKLGGKFSRDDWGKLNYNHTDHHLRQFGV